MGERPKPENLHCTATDAMKPDPEMVINELPATGAVFGETEVHAAKKASGS